MNEHMETLLEENIDIDCHAINKQSKLYKVVTRGSPKKQKNNSILFAC